MFTAPGAMSAWGAKIGVAMLTGELARIYMSLWSLSRDATPPVDPVYSDSIGTMGARAIFIPGEDDDPQIRVARALPPDDDQVVPPPDVAGADLHELITLAHERGHEMSWRARTYEVRTIAEEHRAWSHAEMLLRALGFQEWQTFLDHKQDSLNEHGRRHTPEG